MILITGAAGKTGKAIVGALAARGAPVRALVRRPEQIAALQASGATEVFVGDLRNGDDLQGACQQIATLYHICPNMQPDEVQIAAGVIAAACRSRANTIGSIRKRPLPSGRSSSK